jgi:AcrR family transcriptional regulator
MSDDPLSARREPRQQRARDTVDHLLATAATLLDEVGIEGFNTNALAERAGVRVRTVYRYWPTKYAVLAALAQRATEQWSGWFAEVEALADPRSDWRTIWRGLLRAWLVGIAALPGGRALRRAVHAVPELRDIDQRDNERLARRLAAALAARLGRAEDELYVPSRTLLESAAAVLDVALEDQGRTEPLYDALAAMQVGYLERLLAEDTPRAVTRPPDSIPHR